MSTDSARLPTLPAPPRVPGTPLIGNVIDFQRRPRDFLIDAAARLGDVFRISTPIGHVTFVTGPACKALAQQPEEAGLHREGFFTAFEKETDVDIFGVQGEVHQRLRTLLKLGYSRQVAAAQASEVAKVVAEVCAPMQPKQAIDLFKVGSNIALWSAMALATPIDLRAHTSDFTRAGHTVMSIMVRRSPPASAYTPWYRLAKGRMWAKLGEVIARHRAGELAASPTTSMTDAFLQATTPEGLKMDDRAARGAVAYAIVGTDIYVGRIIGFMLYELARDPDLLAHVRREVDTAFADGVFDPSRLRRLPYLRGAYLETLRFYPLLPGMAFFPSRDLEVGGYLVPKGELIFLSPQIGHFSPRFYKNPQTFDATRCMAPRNEHHQSGAHAAFGAGKRTCLATGLVEIVALTAISALLRQIDFELERPTQTLDLVMDPLIAPKTPVRAVVRSRRTASDTQIDPSALSEAVDMTPVIEERRGQALPTVEPEDHPAGTLLVEQGKVADAFFVLLEGSAEVSRSSDGAPAEVLRTLEPGSSFGELGLLKSMLRTATVKALTPVRVLRVPRQLFMSIVSDHDLTAGELGAYFKRRYVEQGLRQAMPALDVSKLSNLASVGALVCFKPGEPIIQEGHLADAFFVIASGEVEVFKQAPSGRVLLRTLEAGATMGEIGIVQSRPRTATCVAKTAVDAIRIERQVFLELLAAEGAVADDVATLIGRRLMNDLAKLSGAGKAESEPA